MKPILVCTPTWNKAQFLGHTLYNVRLTTDAKLYRHIVVDNGSTDDTRQVCENLKVERIKNIENVGIAQALNQVLLRLEPGQRFMKLDDDLTFFNPGWMEAMLQVLEDDNLIGGVAVPRLGREADQLCGSIHTNGSQWIVEATSNWWSNCAMYQYEAVRDLGSFWQPGLYGYEDELTGVRLRKLGWRTVYLASFRVLHNGSWQTKRELPQYRKWKLEERTKKDIRKLMADFETGVRDAFIPLQRELAQCG